ncbi:MAG TPA: DsbC family protein [Steroidobacteraceae bacterium]|nr:DsbC family protein [Steroidobacteraceae bacterium]
MIMRWSATAAAWLAAALTGGPLAAEQPRQAAPAADPRAEIAGRIPGARPEDLRPSPIPGLYELRHGADILYVTADGQYGINGDLYDIGRNVNLTENVRRETRAHLIAAVPEDQMLVFGPRDPKYTITVFTDVDCGYCRQLHSQIAEYNHLGIRVRYLFYPRSGPNTESWTKAEEVWCSANRNDALTQAKRGMALPAKVCANNPVARHYALGQQFGLQGTPAIVLPDGELVSGYLPPPVLAQRLQSSGG